MRNKGKKAIPYGEEFMVKGINDRLYSHLSMLSTSPREGLTLVYKSYIKGNHSKHAKELGISRQKFARDLGSLISKGFIKETQIVSLQGNIVESYELVLGNENPFKLIPMETLKHLTYGTSNNVVKLYVYLLNKWGWRKSDYTFTYQELVKDCFGMNVTRPGNNDIARICLNILYKLGLVDFCQYSVNMKNQFRLLNVNLNYDAKLKKEEDKVFN